MATRSSGPHLTEPGGLNRRQQLADWIPGSCKLSGVISRRLNFDRHVSQLGKISNWIGRMNMERTLQSEPCSEGGMPQHASSAHPCSVARVIRLRQEDANGSIKAAIQSKSEHQQMFGHDRFSTFLLPCLL